MTPMDLLTPALLGLAFFGYVRCLASRPLVTLALTLAFGALMSRIYAFAPENMLTWLGAGLLVVVAYVAARLWPVERARATTAPTGSKPGRTKAPSNKFMNNGDQIVIDGTNVIYWDDNEPAVSTLLAVVQALQNRGFAPYVFLDASSRHHVKNKSLDAKGFARALGLPASRVQVCPAGTEADAFILKYARSEGAPVVSNDRFGDRAAQVKGIKLVKGIFANGKPIFEGL